MARQPPPGGAASPPLRARTRARVRTTDGILLVTTFITRFEQACLVTNQLKRSVCDIFALCRDDEWAPAVSHDSIPREQTHLHAASCALFVVALEQDGYAVLEEFLRPAECDELFAAGLELTKKLPDSINIFSTTDPDNQQLKDQYFLNSNDKISYFYEKDAIGADGNLKVGHALHLLQPIFRCYTYSDRVKAVCRQIGFSEPAVVQSIRLLRDSENREKLSYDRPAAVYPQSSFTPVPVSKGRGTRCTCCSPSSAAYTSQTGEGCCAGKSASPSPQSSRALVEHQDITFLHTEPIPPIGFWIALEDATIQNGCLWVARGSHKSGVHRRLLRDSENREKLSYDRPAAVYPQSSFTPVPVSKGTCILIHGNVVHKSAPNRSSKSRHAYTFHVIEKRNNTFSPDNWLQEGENAPFVNLYTTNQME
ncbi:hypothetical protein MSG28_000830 [Choristoneura fumiferana]|uniref:Uncharacterized protein n=1 Tax=Choristoneura fumiferana TaxID=7141 RepID=A0ACC0K2M1_CHOFU|nr:hypothetical protein MSG28_000830 [Choristoneura fumiferana]